MTPATATVRDVTSEKDYAIIEALQQNDPSRAFRLVNEAQIGINAKDSQGMSALMIAVVQKQNVLVGTLLNAVAPRVDVNAKNPQGFTALHYAVGQENVPIARALLQRGADPNAQADTGLWTPLHFSAKFGNADLVDLLLEFHADPLIRGSQNDTVLDVANDLATHQKLADHLNNAALLNRELRSSSLEEVGL